MKPRYNKLNLRNHAFGASIAIVVCLSGAAMADTEVTWSGSTSTEWTTATNWTGDVVPTSGLLQHAVIDTITPKIATITVGAIPPLGIFVGHTPGATGRLDHIAGDAATGSARELLVGRNGSIGTYNLADTTTTGGTHTGFGTGTGSMTVNASHLYIGGFDGTGGVGTVNVNTTGTLNIGSRLEIGTSASSGTLNLDNGTIITNYWTEVGNGIGCTGTLNMSGGTLTKQGGEHMIIAAGGGTGVANVSGGTININNELWVGQAGGSNGTLNLSAGTINVASWCAVGRGGSTGTFNLSGGTFNAGPNGDAFIVGDQNNSTGTMVQSGGAANIDNQFWVGAGGGTNNGHYTLEDGTLSVNTWIAIGRGGSAIFDMTGGTFTKNANDSNFIIGAGGTGVMNMSGGIVSVADSGPIDRGVTWISENGNGTLNLSGTAEFTTERFVVAAGGTGTGNLNLDGGTIYTGHILGGAGVANASFNGTQIVATIGSTDFIANLDTASVGLGGLKLDNNGYNLTVPQVLGGGGGLVKSGLGILALTAVNTYTGATSVTGGKLAITTASDATGAVTLADECALGLAQSAIDEIYTTSALTMGSTWDTTLDLDLGNFPSNTANAPLTVGGPLTLNGKVTVNIVDTNVVTGTIPLVSYAGPKAGSGSFALGTLPDGVVANLVSSDVAGPSSLALNVTRANDPYWTGTVSNLWNTADSNWNNEFAGGLTTYADPDPAMFDDRVVAGPTNIILNGTVAPGGSGVTFNNSLYNYTLAGTGKISGGTGLLKQGTGSLNLGTVNEYTGVTTLSGGTVTVAALANGGVASPLGMASSLEGNLVFNGGTLNYTGPNTTIDRGFTITGANSGISTLNDLTISGSVFSTGGGLNKLGAGNLTLTHESPLIGGGGQVNKITGGTLSFIGNGSQNATIPGELWVGSIPDSAGHLVLDHTNLTVGSWITIGRGTGNTGVVCTLTATNSTLQCNQLSTGFDADLGYNSATQLITLTNTAFTNIGRTALSEKQNDTTTMTLAGTSSFTSPLQFQMALNATAVANLTIQDDATMTLTGNWFSIGNDGTGVCTVKNNGSLSKTGGDFNISDVGVSKGTLNIQDNATVTAGNVVFVGKNNGTTGTVNMDGGTFNTNTYITIGRGAGSTGVFHMNGGTINQTDPNAGIALGEQGNGTLNLNGGSVNVGGGGFYITTETTTTGVGVANLNGGTLTAKRVTARDGTSGTSTLNLNGGLLQAGPGASLDFISNLDTITVQTGGAKIDSNGQTIAINQILLGDAGNGGLTKSGDGFLQLNAANTYTGATTVTAGSLGGTGSVAGPLLVSAAGTLAPGASTGTFTAGASTIAGTYACEIDGANSDKLVSNGSLDVSAATLAITQLSAPSAPVYIIASYTGTTPAAFASVTGLPSGYTLNYNYLAGNQIALVQTATPYGAWVSGYFPGESNPAVIGAAADPDGDGSSNIAEFALDGNPNSGASTGKVVGKVASVGGSPVLVLTVPARTGATFSGTSEQVSALIDGVIYKIQGSDELATWNLVVTEVLGTDKTTIETGMPVLNTGWIYRTFQSPGTIQSDPADFLRAVIENP